ncbi:hypothetical protein [Micromonospora sp. WMMD998]|uniref:hypothetical protein n=1 Tax=Micromonospora sp. WMMD998 TaxID=3016092 RepID=UPI00249BF62F|nr:hypothetical protein [Micromonospora sp. WMMD998]WFE41926.1 hypothetical protein O7619_27160 [Micromonospora sp. WMMD998]
MAVKLSAQLTGENRELNGLNLIEQTLIDQPRGERYAVVRYAVKRVSDEIDEGVHVATAKIVHIEPVDGAVADRVRDILAERYKDRTGKSLDGDPTLFDSVVPGGEQDDEQDDGEREVPEASAEELMAERDERKAAGLPAFSDGGEPA